MKTFALYDTLKGTSSIIASIKENGLFDIKWKSEVSIAGDPGPNTKSANKVPIANTSQENHWSIWIYQDDFDRTYDGKKFWTSGGKLSKVTNNGKTRCSHVVPSMTGAEKSRMTFMG